MGKKLLVGPPGSGKTHTVLAALEAAVRQQRASQVKLIVPTASMAQHALHTLARRGLAVPADLVETIADSISGLTPGLREPSAAIASRLLEKAIAAVDRDEFRQLSQAAGLHAEFLAAMRAFWAAGSSAEAARPYFRTPWQSAFGAVFQKYEELLAEKDFVHPAERLRCAAEEIQRDGLQALREVYFDGFVNFSAPEQILIKAVADKVDDVLVTFPEFAGGNGADPAFPEIPVERLKVTYRPRVSPAVLRAKTPEQEVEEVARRIAVGGRPFNEYALILRTPEIYTPLIQLTFERFGIPFRMRPPKLLGEHGAIMYLIDLLACIDEGFPGERTVEVLNRSWCPAGLHPEMEEYDFLIREKLPGSGLDFFEHYADRFPKVRTFLRELSARASWSKETRSPRHWMERCLTARREWLRLPVIDDGVTPSRVLELRSLARALSQFDAATQEAAEILELENAGRIELRHYLSALTAVLRQTFLRTPDQRRNVVNVLTAYEARQWELPVVFLCGLVEGQFPRHHAENLLFSDGECLRLSKQGIHLRTASQLDQEERSLFEIATSRATQELVLSYPEFDSGGRPLLRSFFLGGSKEHDKVAPLARLRENPLPFGGERAPALLSADLIEAVVQRHLSFSPTSLESYLQCPYQFFARHTLRLEGRPAVPERRIDVRWMGILVHRTIKRWSEDRSKPIREVFNQLFDEMCQAQSVRKNFRTAVIHNSLLSDMERFASEEFASTAAGVEQHFETDVEYVVEVSEGPPVRISGRVDRYDVFDGEIALVVDYKYSSESLTKRVLDGHAEGSRVQGPLYLLGLEQVRGVRPAGMRFWGLRGKTVLRGWVVPDLIPIDQILKGDQRLSEPTLRGLLANGERLAVEAITEIRLGRLAVEPRDRDICRKYCEFRDVCRVQL